MSYKSKLLHELLRSINVKESFAIFSTPTLGQCAVCFRDERMGSWIPKEGAWPLSGKIGGLTLPVHRLLLWPALMVYEEVQ